MDITGLNSFTNGSLPFPPLSLYTSMMSSPLFLQRKQHWLQSTDKIPLKAWSQKVNCKSQSIWIWSEPFIVTKMSKDKVSAVNLDNTFNAPSINSQFNTKRAVVVRSLCIIVRHRLQCRESYPFSVEYNITHAHRNRLLFSEKAYGHLDCMWGVQNTVDLRYF